MSTDRAIEDTAIAALIDGNPIQPDGVPFFHNSRANLVIGAGSTLSATNLQDAITRVADNSGHRPHWLIVPPALIMRAAQILNSVVLIAAYPSGGKMITPVMELAVCDALDGHDAWAVSTALDPVNAEPRQWVTYAGV